MDLKQVMEFADLFHGRNDAYFDGKGARWSKPTIGLYQRHLEGSIEGIGTYPVTDDALCRWSCIDLDGDQYTFDSASEVEAVWTYYGVKAWIERSRSKGWHIWTFSDGWIPAAIMRNAGLQVASIAKLPKGTEVNPKNDAPWKLSRGLVNTVRLPYAGRAKPQRQVMVEASTALALSAEGFTSQARQARSAPAVLRTIAGLWTAARATEALTERYRALLGTGPATLLAYGSRSNQDALQILTGKRNVMAHERDNQLYTLARLMHAMSIPIVEARSRMVYVWTHQVEQNNPDYYPLETALKKIERVYG